MNRSQWRSNLYTVIFESGTRAGKAFDILLIISILLSVIVVMVDSVKHIHDTHGEILYSLEWFFTLLFTTEYILRLICIERPLLYAKSFFGIVDFIAIVPTYLSLLVPGTQTLLVIRVLRVLRIFRILKIVHYIGEANLLLYALRKNRHKVVVFLVAILSLVIIFGSFMYLIEGENNIAFTSIPTSVYWAIVTMTTVGYGDISPQTPLGQTLAAIIMIVGYSIIVVPTVMLTMSMARVKKQALSKKVCSHCSAEGHDDDADFCKYCGNRIKPKKRS